jgi:hypothetical protein
MVSIQSLSFVSKFYVFMYMKLKLKEEGRGWSWCRGNIRESNLCLSALPGVAASFKHSESILTSGTELTSSSSINCDWKWQPPVWIGSDESPIDEWFNFLPLSKYADRTVLDDVTGSIRLLDMIGLNTDSLLLSESTLLIALALDCAWKCELQ